jgi:hypothetical protein
VQLGATAYGGAKQVAGAVGYGLSTVKNKWIEHKVDSDSGEALNQHYN